MNSTLPTFNDGNDAGSTQEREALYEPVERLTQRAQESWRHGRISEAVVASIQALEQMQASGPSSRLCHAYLEAALFCRDFGLYQSSMGLAMRGFDSAILIRDPSAALQAIVLMGIGFAEVHRADAASLLLKAAWTHIGNTSNPLNQLRTQNGVMLAALASGANDSTCHAGSPGEALWSLATELALKLAVTPPETLSDSAFAQATMLKNTGRVLTEVGELELGLQVIRRAIDLAELHRFENLALIARLAEIQCLFRMGVPELRHRLQRILHQAQAAGFERVEELTLKLGAVLPCLNAEQRAAYARQADLLGIHAQRDLAGRMVASYVAHLKQVLTGADPLALALNWIHDLSATPTQFR